MKLWPYKTLMNHNYEENLYKPNRISSLKYVKNLTNEKRFKINLSCFDVHFYRQISSDFDTETEN